MAGRAALAAGLCSALVGCGDAAPDDPVACTDAGVIVADPTAWRVVTDDADDPWGPAVNRCPATQHRTEVQADARWHEVETRGCGTATVLQPARTALCAGDTIAIDVWHFPITEGDGDWQIAIGVIDDDGFEEVMSDAVPLPGAATTFSIRVPVGRAVERGDTIALRIRNHGTNTWNLYPLTTADAPE